MLLNMFAMGHGLHSRCRVRQEVWKFLYSPSNGNLEAEAGASWVRSILHTIMVIFHLFSSFLTVLSKTWKQDSKEQTMKPCTQDKQKFGIITITSRRVYSH